MLTQRRGRKKVGEVDFWIGYRKEAERTGVFLVSLRFSLQGRIRPRHLSVARAWSSVCGPRTGIPCLKPGFLLRIGKKPFLAFTAPCMHMYRYMGNPTSTGYKLFFTPPPFDLFFIPVMHRARERALEETPKFPNLRTVHM